MTADDERFDELVEADKRLLSSLGVPAWAQVTGSGDSRRPRLFAWVDEDLGLHARLVGDAEADALRVLSARACEVLSGHNESGTHGQPADLDQPTALAVVHEHSVGYGSMGRSAVRPLAELVAFAQEQIQELTNQLPHNAT